MEPIMNNNAGNFRQYHKLMKLRFPADVDTRSFWAFVDAMGWRQYVIEERVEPTPKPDVDILAVFRKIDADNRSYKELYEEMYNEKYAKQ